MIEKTRKISSEMVKEINKNTNTMKTQRHISVKTGKDLLAAARKMVGEEFSKLNTNLPPSKIGAIARIIVLGSIKDDEKPV